ncbi:TetR/AcrR family transcriptional regulator [Nocardia mexicana]|uniref:TetR family transcriptional regulator n=1 Tax=Nocardia mexicana TaxID=279262 RepID=A0A370H6Q1_9NOCA|nr:TetR/AcrR family transcriptional regulator [Nocardia mexicana]RDI51162.1 TetR family transcriptional regulator [Nocardia mexicana]
MNRDSSTAPTGRRYAGLTPAERTEQRRAAILAAALELFGTKGYANSPVKQICQEAGLTERYFYESFADREDCLAALYSGIAEEMRAVTVAAVQEAAPDLDAVTRAGLAAFIGYLTDSPRRARVDLIEVVGVSEAMEQRRHAVLGDFTEIILATWAASRGRAVTPHLRSMAVVLAGGVNHLLVDWLMGGRQQSPAELVEACATIFSAVRVRVDAL